MDINRPDAESGFEPHISRRAFGDSFRQRRREQRATMTRVICFNILSAGPENGGVVTDVSSSGMGLRADMPMDAAPNLDFAIMVDRLRLQGSGEIVWMDQERKSCGLRFTSVTPALRLQINKWIGQSESSLPVPPVPNDTDPRSRAEPAPTPAEPEQTVVTEPQFPTPQARETFLMDDWEKQEREASTLRSRTFAGGVATGLLLAGIVVGVLFYLGIATLGRIPALANVPGASLLSRSSAPSSPAPSTTSRPASANVPTTPQPAPQPASIAPATPVPPASLPAPSPAAHNDSSPRQQDPVAASPTHPANQPSPNGLEQASSPSPAAATDEAAIDEADGFLRAGRDREAAAVLWRSVSTGNIEAETKLADLYLLGKGVTKSCAQGRVLLTAAAKKGNADAQQRLSTLLRTGCR